MSWSIVPLVLLSMAAPTDDAEPGLVEQCRREVVDLHVFFEDWFQGRLDDTDAAFSRFADAMATDLVYIGPSGRAATRDALLTGLRARHGVWSGSDARIWIEDVDVRTLRDGLALVTYVEWQTDPAGETRARRSSVVLETDATGPDGLVWRHVHETWTIES